MIGYFNYLPFGGGDDMFWLEMLGIDKRPFILLTGRDNVREVFLSQSNATGKPILGKVSVEISHFFHGNRESRSYKHRHYVLLTQYPWKDSVITDDASGILCWVEQNSMFVQVASRLPEMNDNIDIIQRFMGGLVDYQGFYNGFVSIYNDKNKFQSKSRTDIIKLIHHL